MNYELRRLTSKDIFPMCSIIKKIGLDEFKNCFQNPEISKLIQKGGEDVNASVGIAVTLDIVSVIVGNLPKCEKEIYSFLSSLSGLKVSDLENMDMCEFFKMIKDVVTKEEFKDFFNQASELFR